LVEGPHVHPTLRARALPTAGAEAVTLDEFTTALKITRLDFIKLDVDGHECQVLRGAEVTLRRFRPTMIVELSPYILEESGESLTRLLDLLYGAGYALYDLRGGRPLPREPAVLARIIPPAGGINALAVAQAA
jgi:hypothetical protein